jgi:chromosome segregation ATPase
MQANIQEELARLGKEIEKAKTNISQLEGRKEEITKRMMGEFGVMTIVEAEAKLKEMEIETGSLDEKITKDFAALKEQFQW